MILDGPVATPTPADPCATGRAVDREFVVHYLLMHADSEEPGRLPAGQVDLAVVSAGPAPEL